MKDFSSREKWTGLTKVLLSLTFYGIFIHGRYNTKGRGNSRRLTDERSEGVQDQEFNIDLSFEA